MCKIFILVALIIAAYSRTYPMYKQCDPIWKNEQLGTSPNNTICSAGCLMSSVAMALTGVGITHTPSTLNKWLTYHGGYAEYDLLEWSAVNALGLTFQGKFPNSEIKSKLDQGNIVLCNVHNGRHWVLAYGYNGDNILINDPNYTTPSYTLSEIVDGQNGVYAVKSGSYQNLLGKLKSLRNKDRKSGFWQMRDRGSY